jgi:diaminopimelate decarboxylase
MQEVARIDAPLSLRAGRLFIEECDTVELARRFGTPLYVHSEGQLRRNARRFRDALAAAWGAGPVHVLPSIKANYSLALRHILTDEGMGCDTFGPGELYAAVHAGVEPSLISVNGSVKDAELVRRAIEIGAKITLDSARELDLVVRAAEELGRRSVVRFRVRPDYVKLERPTDFSEESVPIREAARQYKPGIPTADLVPLGRRALGLECVDVAGVMAHLGRHHRDLDVWRGMISAFVATIEELSDAWDGWTPREIDVGGGFATRRDPTGRLLARLEDRVEAAPSIEDYAATAAGALREELRARSLKVDGVTLEIEPGRSLYADTGIHLTTVRNVKREAAAIPWCWIETDTTEMFLLDSLIEHNRWAPVVCDRADAPATQRADIVGKSCGFDVIVPQAAVPNVEIGDVIAILDTGAYEDAASANFNALPRPATVLVHDASAEVIKRAETIEDVFHRDVVPDRLRERAATAALSRMGTSQEG